MEYKIPPDFKFSWSAFESYQSCPLAFYHSYVLKQYSKSNIWAVAGTAIHELLKHCYTSNIFFDNYIYAQWPKFLKAELSIKWKASSYSHFTAADKKQAESYGYGCLKKLLANAKKYKLFDQKALFLELKIDDVKFRGYRTVAKIDIGFEFPEGLTLADWKSGKQKEDHVYQLCLYAGIYARKTGREVKFIAPIYFDSPLKLHPLNDEVKQRTHEYIDRQFRGITSGSFPARKNEYCDGCSVKLSGKCPLWK